tara:strand:+ start:252 stop:416 length:165 start_codon:yes stop_codon:yes gene_type:complete
MQNRKNVTTLEDDVHTLLDRIVTLHELQASLEDIDIEVAKARVLLDGLNNTKQN